MSQIISVIEKYVAILLVIFCSWQLATFHPADHGDGIFIMENLANVLPFVLGCLGGISVLFVASFASVRQRK